MSTVACDWNDQLLVLLIIREYFPKPICHVEKIRLSADFALQKLRLHLELVYRRAKLLFESIIACITEGLVFALVAGQSLVHRYVLTVRVCS